MKKTVEILIPFMCGVLVNNIIISSINEKYNNDDLTKIKEHITLKTTLSRKEVKKLDINKDGRITSIDYVMVKNKLQ